MMGTTKESELHILGKSVFEDAAGKDIQLPAPPSPRFNPTVATYCEKRWSGKKSCRMPGITAGAPMWVLTSDKGIKVIVEVKYSNGKGINYGFDLARAGHWLAVELNVRQMGRG